ncbi:MAG: glycosyltransferase family 2 protein [Desulfobacteraceae bacterium]|nr:glycosyltransferase family 2 protein [Desulfobacteraceae bacterium]
MIKLTKEIETPATDLSENLKDCVKISYVVPAFNEESSILNTLQRLIKILSETGITYEIILVNDGSRDKTIELSAQFPEVRVINHPVNIGYGNALKSGIKNARYEWIGIVDADGSYPIEDIPQLIKEMQNGYDMVIGSRINTAQMDKPVKKIFRWIYKTILKLVVKNTIEDANSGFRMFSRDMAINLLPFLCGTFSFTTSLTILAMGNAFFVKHIPIQYSRRDGQSKVRHFRDSLRTLLYIVQGITFFNPIKFFMILAFCMILAVCIPAMFLALFRMPTLSLYYMIFGTTVTLLIAIGVLGDIIRISLMKVAAKISQEQNNK